MKSIHDKSYRLLIAMLKKARKMQNLTHAEMAERRGGRDILYPSCQAKSSFITIPTG
jgi:hypothetical protein